ncbi:hypothetical protein [Desulfomarina sp.]
MDSKKKKIWLLNVLFALFSIALITFLLNAPDETTSPLPRDDIHIKFHKIKKKKEAEKFCLKCHDEGQDSPLPEGHPPKYRCLFCHKRS